MSNKCLRVKSNNPTYTYPQKPLKPKYQTMSEHAPSLTMIKRI